LWRKAAGSQADWDTHLAGITSTPSPANYLEEQLVYKIGLTLQQWHRFDRYKRAALVRSMEEGKTFFIRAPKRLSLSWKQAFTHYGKELHWPHIFLSWQLLS
jgi:hypothetical protein